MIAREVQRDHAFIVHRSESIVREYVCNAEGKVVSAPALPERSNFLYSPVLAKFGDFSLEEPAVPPQ